MLKTRKKVIAALTICAVTLTAVPAMATSVLVSYTLGGTSQKTSYVTLGSGTRYITGSGITKSGTAQAKKINTYSPDITVATISVKAGQYSQDDFTAQEYTGDDDEQSYYIKWTSSYSASSATVRFQG